MVDNVLSYMYDIQFFIGDEDFSGALNRVEITASIDHIMNLVLIQFSAEPSTILQNQIFGKEEITLIITMTSIDTNGGKSEPIEKIETKLITLKTDFPVNPKDYKHQENLPAHEASYQPRTITIICSPQTPFKYMYTPVNKIVENDSGKTPITIVSDLADEFLEGVTKTVETENSNNVPPTQLLIPPQPFASAIKYINRKYPLYNGSAPFIFFRIDDNSLCIWDLRSKLNTKNEYTVILLSGGIKEEEEIGTTPGVERDRYFTSNPIQTDYSGNLKYVRSAYNNTFISHPPDDLYELIDVNLDDVFKKNALTTKTSSIYINDDLKKLTRYHPSVSLTESVADGKNTRTDDTPLRQYVSNQIKNPSKVLITVDGGNLPFIKLSRVGVRMEIESNQEEYANYKGFYIVSKAMLTWDKRSASPNFYCNVNLECIRGYYQ